MGSCLSKPQDATDGPASAVSRAIDKALKEDEKRLEREVKLLLLGAGASGKSTVLKQMRLLHNKPFSPDEVEDYRKIIFSNIVGGMKNLIDIMDERGIAVSQENRGFIEAVDSEPPINTGQPYPIEYQHLLQRLWDDRGVRHCWDTSFNYALPENMPYFYADLGRLFDTRYKPTHDDILRVRSKTTGISETRFEINDRVFRLFDVGGQRSERRKWASCFENVTSVIFLASLADYNSGIIEDQSSNGMHEALMLFRSIATSQWFLKSSMILFLNKADLLMKKVRDPRQQLIATFPNYRGKPGSYKDAIQFFKDAFREGILEELPNKEIYTHVTTATDSGALRVVMTAVTDTIVRNSLRDMRIL